LDDIRSADDFVAAWYGVLVHTGWIHPHPAAPRNRRRADPCHSRTKPGLAAKGRSSDRPEVPLFWPPACTTPKVLGDKLGSIVLTLWLNNCCA